MVVISGIQPYASIKGRNGPTMYNQCFAMFSQTVGLPFWLPLLYTFKFKFTSVKVRSPPAPPLQLNAYICGIIRARRAARAASGGKAPATPDILDLVLQAQEVGAGVWGCGGGMQCVESKALRGAGLQPPAPTP